MEESDPSSGVFVVRVLVLRPCLADIVLDAALRMQVTSYCVTPTSGVFVVRVLVLLPCLADIVLDAALRMQVTSYCFTPTSQTYVGGGLSSTLVSLDGLQNPIRRL